MRDFDTFSFQAQSSKQINSARREEDFQVQVQVKPQTTVKNWREMTYRFENKNKIINQKDDGIPIYQAHHINERIQRLDEELSDNIRRRIQLEKKLYQEKQDKRQIQNQKFFAVNHVKNQEQVTKIYTNIQRKSEDIQKMMSRSQPLDYQKSQDSQIEQKQSNQQKKLFTKQKTEKKVIVPNQLKIQKMLRSATFPQTPTCNLQKLEQECLQVTIHSEHSDAVYIMMVVSFHLQKYHNVRKYFKQIQMFKNFQPKAYWVACETQFELQSHQLCLKLLNICMKQLSDIYLPRFVFLQARCFQKVGNLINSIVCYNQVIKMQPKVAELYLERAMIYDKIGYHLEAKQDYIQFGILEPRAKEILKEKIMGENNQIKRKEMIKALAKIT